jgi:hypothetical protein
MATKKGSTGKSSNRLGGSAGSMETSLAAKRRYAEKMRKEEEYWASLAGPVTISYAKDKVSQ